LWLKSHAPSDSLEYQEVRQGRRQNPDDHPGAKEMKNAVSDFGSRLKVLDNQDF
jgi:hypothetical protein